ncbi:MAG: tail fiber domain-containing protein, partial [Caldilineaceae bacterium]
ATAAGRYGGVGDAFRGAAGSPLIGQAQNLYGQAQDYFGRVVGGGYLPQNNPYFQSMVDQSINAARPSIDSAFASSGRLGSGAHAAAFADAATRAATSLGYQDYSRERGYQNMAAGSAGQLAGGAGQIAGMGAGLLSQGAGADATGAQLSALAAQLYGQSGQAAQTAATLPGDWLWQQLARYKDAVGQPIMGGGTTTGTQPMQQANPIMQGAGALFGGLGSLGQLGQGAAGLGSLFSFLSDARAKEDITPVGQLDNGLPVYSYRYKGDHRTQIGLLAQEVAQVKPHAVAPMGGGLLGVNYAEAVI